jgi:hypothetical protein
MKCPSYFTEYRVPFALFPDVRSVGKGVAPDVKFVRLVAVPEMKTQFGVQQTGIGHRVVTQKNVTYFSNAVPGTPFEEILIYATRVSVNRLYTSQELDADAFADFTLAAQTTLQVATVLHLLGLVTAAQLRAHLKYAEKLVRELQTRETLHEREEEFSKLLQKLGPMAVRRLLAEHDAVYGGIKVEEDEAQQ